LQAILSDSGVVDGGEMPSLWDAVYVNGEVSREDQQNWLRRAISINSAASLNGNNVAQNAAVLISRDKIAA
jgi:hypothetical protein